jgi:hypothetical protein
MAMDGSSSVAWWNAVVEDVGDCGVPQGVDVCYALSRSVG